MDKPMECPKCGQGMDCSASPTCLDCGLVATWWNEKTGEIYDSCSLELYESRVEAMQAELDGAFDHQYFEEW